MVGESRSPSYSRKQVRRVAGVTERQLRSWERQELIPVSTEYGFVDLLALRTLVKLRQSKVSVTKIRKALAALREKLDDVDNPLVELRLFSEGRNVRVQLGRQTMEPVTGQLLLDFGKEELEKLVSFPGRPTSGDARKHGEQARLDQLFQRALEAEQSGQTEDAIAGYLRVVEADPSFAGAFVNLGTIYFTARDLAKAEHYYRRAIEAEPNYALAHFDLGNLYDELGERAAALLEYESALKLDPNYADAHYNVALLYQASNQTLKAMSHWKAYLKLDPMSPWASIARRELSRVYRETVVENRNRKP